jgi:drug/metabolite transporter (DMT)-like permease
VDAISLLALRMAMSLPLFAWLVWFSRRQGGSALTPGDGLRVALLGLFGYYLASLFDFYGLQYISAGLERLILFTYPTLVLLIQAVAQRERPTLRTWRPWACATWGWVSPLSTTSAPRGWAARWCLARCGCLPAR